MEKLDKEKIKKTKKKLRKSVTKEVDEFKKFIMQGNIVDMAVGVIIGGAFGKIVTSLVNDILMPLIGILIGGIDFTKLSITVLDAQIMYGSFIQQVIDFLIVSICIFVFLKIIAKLGSKFKKSNSKVDEENKNEEDVTNENNENNEKDISKEIKLLTEIRDLLKDDKDKNNVNWKVKCNTVKQT